MTDERETREVRWLGLEPTDLDGHTLDELTDYLDAGRQPADRSIDESPGCQLALDALERLQGLGAELIAAEAKEKELDEKILKIMMTIPNIIDASVPVGKDDSENVEVERFGEPVVPDFPVPYHTEIMESFNGIDLDAARRVAPLGARRGLRPSRHRSDPAGRDADHRGIHDAEPGHGVLRGVSQ